MAEIDSLGTNFYYAGVQNSSNQALKNQKTEKSQKTTKSKFSDLVKSNQPDNAEETNNGLPSIISTMSIEDAAIYLKDAVDNAGNDFSDNQSEENLEKFKSSVRNFIKFLVENNYEISSYSKRLRRPVPSRLFYFSSYSVPPKKEQTIKFKAETINQKLDDLARETLSTQMDNLKILAQVNEIKGLVIDLLRE